MPTLGDKAHSELEGDELFSKANLVGRNGRVRSTNVRHAFQAHSRANSLGASRRQARSLPSRTLLSRYQSRCARPSEERPADSRVKDRRVGQRSSRTPKQGLRRSIGSGLMIRRRLVRLVDRMQRRRASYASRASDALSVRPIPFLLLLQQIQVSCFCISSILFSVLISSGCDETRII